MFEHLIFAHSDRETRSLFYEIFTDQGYKVTTAISCKEVLETLKKERPSYIVLDPAISDISAQTLSEKVRAIDENIKILILDADKDKSELMQEILKVVREQWFPHSRPLEQKGAQLQAKILIVDDEKECAELIRGHLAKKGYQVDCAFSGEEAMFKIETGKPNIIFMDICLPAIDGIVVLKKIKNINKSMIVIMTTAIEDDKVVKEAMELGADGYLVKPFNLAKLEETIFANLTKQST